MPLRTEARLLQLEKDRLTRAHQTPKQRAQRADNQSTAQAQRIKELERENERRNQELEPSQKTKKRSQVARFDQGPLRQRPTGPKQPKGGHVSHGDTNREARRVPPVKERVRLLAPTCVRDVGAGGGSCPGDPPQGGAREGVAAPSGAGTPGERARGVGAVPAGSGGPRCPLFALFRVWPEHLSAGADPALSESGFPGHEWPGDLAQPGLPPLQSDGVPSLPPGQEVSARAV